MKCWIGLGSNQGDRLSNLEQAARKLKQVSAAGFHVSPIDVNPAMVPLGAPDSWRIPFFNAVVEMEWPHSATELLHFLKQTECELGRIPAERWAPRIIDLDLLIFGDQIFSEPNLQVPHPRICDRSFVLGPFSQMRATLQIPGKSGNILSRLRQLPSRSPQWMGIFNLTPDSFSDGGTLSSLATFQNKVVACEQAAVGFLDLGAESTRPGAAFVDFDTEWSRLRPTLEWLRDHYRDRILRPRISVDTRHAKIAERALEWGADVINDVSGLSDPAMIEILQSRTCDYVLMHSLSVPADPKRILALDADPVSTVHRWAEEKINTLVQKGICLDRLIFDPGLGFGKNATQSFSILRRIEEFKDLPVRLLVGFSRKSFLAQLNPTTAMDRDWESVGVSLQLISKGVDILRVHEAPLHIRAYRAFQESE